MKIQAYLMGAGLAAILMGAVMPVYGQSQPNVQAAAVNPNTVNYAPTTLPTEWPTQDTYWQQNFSTRPYYQTGMTYDVYWPAYLYGTNAYIQFKGQLWDAGLGQLLQSHWSVMQPNTNLTWTQVAPAVKDAYEHMYDTHKKVNEPIHADTPPPTDNTITTAGAESKRSPTGAFSSTGTALGR